MHRRSRAGVASLNRLLYAIGGFDGIKDLSSAEVRSYGCRFYPSMVYQYI